MVMQGQRVQGMVALTVVAMFACLVAVSAAQAPGKSAATVTGAFADSCRDFAVHSSKDISHVEIHYVSSLVIKDESINSHDHAIDGGTGDEIEFAIVKSGRTVAEFACAPDNTAPTARLEIKTPPRLLRPVLLGRAALRPIDPADGLDEYQPDSGRWRQRVWRLPLGLRIRGRSLAVFVHHQLPRDWQQRSGWRHHELVARLRRRDIDERELEHSSTYRDRARVQLRERLRQLPQRHPKQPVRDYPDCDRLRRPEPFRVDRDGVRRSDARLMYAR